MDDVAWTLLDSSKRRFGFTHLVAYLLHCLKAWLGDRKADVVVVDDMYAAPVAWLIRPFARKAVWIQDVRELYVREDLPSLRWRVLNRLEYELARRVDLVLCASGHRGLEMSRRYDLVEVPTTFLNIRDLRTVTPIQPVSDDFRAFCAARRRLVTTGGWSFARRTEDLVREVGSLGPDYALAICGWGTAEERGRLEEMAVRLGFNLHFLGRLSAGEMRAVVDVSHAGVVSYHRGDLNNEFCAPGKLYEYISLGKPIIATANPPLVEFCEEFGVGVANDSFRVATEMLFADYEAFVTACTSLNVGDLQSAQFDAVRRVVGLKVGRRGHDAGRPE